MTINKERRDEIRAAAEKATPGPWRRHEAGDDVVIVGHPKNWPCSRNGVEGEWEVATVDDFFGEDRAAQHSNAAHIANCDPQTILALLDALDAAEKAEPVAWEGYWPGAGSADSYTKLTRHKSTADDWVSDGADVTPLYTHPAPAVREGWKPLTENVVGPVLVCRFGDEDHNWLPLTAYRVTGGKWERPASRDGLPYEPTHWQRLPTAAPEAK